VKEGDPVQWVAVAEAWKGTGVPTAPEVGTVVSQATVQTSPTTMLPVLTQVLLSTATVMVQVYVPVDP
jgi:hypothetical protein